MRRIGLFIILALVYAKAVSQEVDKSFNIGVIPPSPEASALGQYVEVPVGYYTGIPNIGVPIWTLEGRGADLNVQMSYHADGNKVEEVASWVGLGWALNAGGVISRTVRGLPDDSATPFNGGTNPAWTSYLDFNYSSSYHIKDLTGAVSTNEKTQKYDLITQGCLDSEPDAFFFNFGGKSGKFAFSGYFNGSSPEILNGSEHKVIIEPQFTSGRRLINSWVIKDVDGFIYTFSDIESTLVESFGESSSFFTCNDPYSYTSSWFLTKIESPYGNYQVDFTYTPYTQVSDFQKSHTIMHNVNPGTNCSASFSGSLNTQWSRLTTSGKRLQSIANSDGVGLTFVPGASRTDVSGQNLYRLDAIEASYHGTVKRKFKFDYYTGVERLLLKSIQETSSDELESKQPWVFEYNSTPLPALNSKEQDYWGYYNSNDKSHLIPPIAVLFNNAYQYFSGADRSPNVSRAKARILEKVTYPTGGHAEFQYELHDFSHLQAHNVELVAKPERTSVTDGVQMTSSGQSENVPITKTIVLTESSEVHLSVFFPQQNNLLTELDALMPYVQVEELGVSQPFFFKKKANDAAVTSAGEYTETVFLQPGSYKISAYSFPSSFNGSQADFASLNFTYYTHVTPQGPKKLAGGGLRISRITHKDNVSSDLIQNFYYVPDIGSEYSSGYLLASSSPGDQNLTYDVLDRYPGFIAEYFTETDGCQYLKRFSSNQAHIAVSNQVEYGSVFVEKGSGADMTRAKFEYRHPGVYGDGISNELPFPPNVSREHERGLLTKETSYLNQSGVFSSLQETTTNYGATTIEVFGVKVARRKYESLVEESHFEAVTYPLRFGFSLISDGTQTLKDPNGDIHSSTVYTYNTNNLLSSLTEDDGKGGSLVTSMIYDHDQLTNPEPDGGANVSMHGKNILNQVRETSVKRVYGSAETIVETERNIFSIHHSSTGIALPQVLKNARRGGLLEEVAQYIKYDSKGNLLEYLGRDGVHVSFIWGYNQNYPVAKLIGVTRGQIETEFADPTFQVTEKLASSQESQLRTSFPNAIITTYEFDPLIGMTKVTNSNGVIVHYHYDKLGRLKQIKDQDLNVLNEYKYNYKN